MNRISELRKKLGLTQTRLGEEIGVSQQCGQPNVNLRQVPAQGNE